MHPSQRVGSWGAPSPSIIHHLSFIIGDLGHAVQHLHGVGLHATAIHTLIKMDQIITNTLGAAPLLHPQIAKATAALQSLHACGSPTSKAPRSRIQPDGALPLLLPAAACNRAHKNEGHTTKPLHPTTSGSHLHPFLGWFWRATRRPPASAVTPSNLRSQSRRDPCTTHRLCPLDAPGGTKPHTLLTRRPPNHHRPPPAPPRCPPLRRRHPVRA